jgi:hypothetical protein
VEREANLYDQRSPMSNVRVTICLLASGLVAACSEPPPPVSVTEFMENPRLLEATMVRCGQNRSEMKYEADCVNARDAINRLERAEERARRVELEAQSERKRQALRRTQQAAAAARQRALEEERRREEAEYLGIFEAAPGTSSAAQQAEPPSPSSNAPVATVEPAPEPEPETSAETDAEQPPASDLEEIREELRRRQQETNN